MTTPSKARVGLARVCFGRHRARATVGTMMRGAGPTSGSIHEQTRDGARLSMSARARVKGLTCTADLSRLLFRRGRPSRAARAAQLRVLEPNASSVRLELRLVPCQVQRHPSAPQPPTARCQRLADTSKRPFQLCHSRSAILRQRSLFMRYQRVRPTVGPLPPVF